MTNASPPPPTGLPDLTGRPVTEALRAAQDRLKDCGDSSRCDAEVLLAMALGRARSYLHAHPEHALTGAQAAKFHALIERRAGGEPVAYITGMREFWSLQLAVTPDTLIPRPETELVVELALRILPAQRALRIADLGTGSGAIALAIAHERPRCHVLATDSAATTLAVARANAARLGIGNVEFRQGDWCAPLAGEHFDLIVSNPPYICTHDPHLAAGDVRFEPRGALSAGPEGLDALRHIVATAHTHLADGGWLLLEHGYDQGEAVTELLRAHGYREVADHTDLAGQARVAQGRWPNT